MLLSVYFFCFSKVATAIGDLQLAGKCRINVAYNYIWLGQYAEADRIIRAQVGHGCPITASVEPIPESRHVVSSTLHLEPKTFTRKTSAAVCAQQYVLMICFGHASVSFGRTEREREGVMNVYFHRAANAFGGKAAGLDNFWFNNVLVWCIRV